MPAVRTIARPPLSDSVMVNIPKEYRSYTLEIIVLPMMNDDSAEDAFANVVTDESRSRKESAERTFNFLMSQDDGGIEPGWHFDREEANSRTCQTGRHTAT